MEEKYSKSLLGIGVLVVFVILSAFIPASWFGIKEVKPEQKADLTVLHVQDLKVLAQDNNKDGVPDWRTLLAKTYDAGVQANPNTKADTKSPLTQEEKVRLNDPNNLTSSFSKNLYVASAYMKENGITDQESQQKLFNELLNQEASKVIIKLYTEKDISISKKEDTASINTYGKSIQIVAAQAVKYNFLVNDIETVQKYLASKKSEDLKPLVTKATQVDTVLHTMLTISVPTSAVNTHLNTLNRLSAYKTILDGLSKTDTDSIRGTLSARQYEATASLLVKSLINFDEYFKAHNVPLGKLSSTG